MCLYVGGGQGAPGFVKQGPSESSVTQLISAQSRHRGQMLLETAFWEIHRDFIIWPLSLSLPLFLYLSPSLSVCFSLHKWGVTLRDYLNTAQGGVWQKSLLGVRLPRVLQSVAAPLPHHPDCVWTSRIYPTPSFPPPPNPLHHTNPPPSTLACASCCRALRKHLPLLHQSTWKRGWRSLKCTLTD